jgi:hypothetical protein
MRSSLLLAPLALLVAACPEANHPTLGDEPVTTTTTTTSGGGGATTTSAGGGATSAGGGATTTAAGGHGGATTTSGSGGATTTTSGSGGATTTTTTGSGGGTTTTAAGGADGSGGHAGGSGPVDAGLDAAHDAAPDAAPGPADIGFYTYAAVPPPAGLVNPPAVAWHPSGAYALVLNANDLVFRYDAATKTLTQVGSVGAAVAWRTLGFTPDGAKAVLLGNTYAAPVEGRVYLWDHVAGTIAEMATEKLAGGSYQAIAWSPDGSQARLLGSKPNQGSYLAYVWTFDPAAGRSNLKAKPTSAGCEDLAYATDAFGLRAVAVTCGVNGVSLFHLDGNDQFVDYFGNAGNTSHIAARPQGDYALAVGWSGQRLYRFELGNWTTGFNSPTVSGGQVEFSTDGRRALVLGGCGQCGGANAVGQVYEFRHDHMAQAEITDVSIPGFGAPPYNAEQGVTLNDAAWRPGCEGGLVVGGANTFSTKRGYVVRFAVDNGVACP